MALPFAIGSDLQLAIFGFGVNGTVSPVVCNEQRPQATGRVPTTLVVGVPLTIATQTVRLDSPPRRSP